MLCILMNLRFSGMRPVLHPVQTPWSWFTDSEFLYAAFMEFSNIILVSCRHYFY